MFFYIIKIYFFKIFTIGDTSKPYTNDGQTTLTFVTIFWTQQPSQVLFVKTFAGFVRKII